MSVNLDEHRDAFNEVGWFIPPYISIGFLSYVKTLLNSNAVAKQDALETCLSFAYSPEHLAAMACERYPQTPYINDYKDIIAEAIEAHFFGLGHVAFTGLVPVIEGVAKKLTLGRSLSIPPRTGMRTIINNLANDCKVEVIEKNIGAVNEIIAMMDSFVVFAEKYLYADWGDYPLDDNTNRHGPLHGFFGDADYGNPINFYKVIAAVDFLCMIAAIRARISWMAPSPTPASQALAEFYRAAHVLRGNRPR